ncbi:MAG: N-acetylneuraminate synthase [Methanomicrobiales archaeon]|nr:N-acetylneuraminate synthase [Methanomicrobiales archaeon]
MPEKVRIGERWIGEGEPVFIIAEAGVNHNGDPGMAERLVAAAAEAGADAIKFQSFTTDDLVTGTAAKAAYQRTGAGEETTQHGMLRHLELPKEALPRLFRSAADHGLVFLSSPFDERAVDELEGVGVPAYKIASGELTNTPLLEAMARKGKPAILSTGMAELEEIGEAIRTLREGGLSGIILLHCVSMYPAPLAGVNFRVIPALRAAFGLPVGYSDHTLGIIAPPVAVALGACLIEKHLTLDRDLPGPDHRMSLEPREFGEMVRAIRDVESGLGTGVKEIAGGEAELRGLVRRSIVATRPIPAGATLTRAMLTTKRPGTGIPPGSLGSLVGRKARRSIAKDTLLSWDMVE